MKTYSRPCFFCGEMFAFLGTRTLACDKPECQAAKMEHKRSKGAVWWAEHGSKYGDRHKDTRKATRSKWNGRRCVKCGVKIMNGNYLYCSVCHSEVSSNCAYEVSYG